MPARRIAVFACTVLEACGHGGGAPIANHGTRGPQGPHGSTSQVRAVDWQNHTYQLDELGPVVVDHGHADFEISEDNKVVAVGVGNGSYEVAPPLFADIDGDGVEDAVISSVLSTGGTGHFSDVRIYTMRGAETIALGTIPGGDRGDGGIRRVALDGSAVIVERNVLAEGDGLCCPSGAQRERWVWRGGEMVEDAAARRAVPH